MEMKIYEVLDLVLYPPPGFQVLTNLNTQVFCHWFNSYPFIPKMTWLLQRENKGSGIGKGSVLLDTGETVLGTHEEGQSNIGIFVTRNDL